LKGSAILRPEHLVVSTRPTEKFDIQAVSTKYAKEPPPNRWNQPNDSVGSLNPIRICPGVSTLDDPLVVGSQLAHPGVNIVRRSQDPMSVPYLVIDRMYGQLVPATKALSEPRLARPRTADNHYPGYRRGLHDHAASSLA
jgi:hypothetical protein